MKTILVLENESLVMDLFRRVLKQYDVIEATGAEQALRYFKDHDGRIDLLVADVTLTVSSGIQVALLLRLETPALPIILISGYPVSDWTGRDYSDLERLGATSVAVLQQPFQAAVLAIAVCKLLGEPQIEVARTA